MGREGHFHSSTKRVCAAGWVGLLTLLCTYQFVTSTSQEINAQFKCFLKYVFLVWDGAVIRSCTFKSAMGYTQIKQQFWVWHSLRAGSPMRRAWDTHTHSWKLMACSFVVPPRNPTLPSSSKFKFKFYCSHTDYQPWEGNFLIGTYLTLTLAL